MFDENASLVRRFKNAKDIMELCEKLKKENYSIEFGVDKMKMLGKILYYVRVLRDNVEKVKVLYTTRDDNSEYKQYLYYFFY